MHFYDDLHAAEGGYVGVFAGIRFHPMPFKCLAENYAFKAKLLFIRTPPPQCNNAPRVCILVPHAPHLSKHDKI